MTYHIALLFVFVGIALVLFGTEWVEADVTALGLLIAMVLTGILPADKAFAGFGSDTVIMILGLLIMTAALMRTGVMDLVGRWIVRHAGDSARRLQMVVMIACRRPERIHEQYRGDGVLRPDRVRRRPQGQRSARRSCSCRSPSRQFSRGTITLIGTSTNLVVSGMLTQYKLAPMGMFEMSPVGIPITLAGLLYMMTLGRRMIPDRFRPEEIGGNAQSMRAYLTEVLVQPESPLIGKTIAQSGLGRDLDLTVVARSCVTRRDSIPARGETEIQAGDIILVQGATEDILKIKDTAGIDIKADVKLADPQLEDKDTGMVEMIILPGSPLIGRTLKEQRFREHYGLQVLGVNRHGEMTHRKVSIVPLQLGDVLLVQGPLAKIEEAADEPTFRVLGDLSATRPNTKRAPLAIAIFVAALALATFEVLSLPVAMMLGALLVFATRCITPQEAYCDVEWKAIILIGSMLALGVAMESTGGARYLSCARSSITSARTRFCS